MSQMFYKTFRRYCSMCQDGCGRTGNNDTAAESLKWGIVFHAIGFRQQQSGQVGSVRWPRNQGDSKYDGP